MSETSRENAADAHSGQPASPASKTPATDSNDCWRVPGVCIFLAAITFAVFGQTLHHEFVNYDDNLYVYDNPVVQKGLTWEGFRWALTYGNIGHWHPLTWLSHMLDCQWYGLWAGGHHLTNVLLHGAAAILLFLVLRQMTGFLWRSAFVAAVFAIHPLRAESVAWVAERKDVLSAFFFMLTLWAYTRYAQEVTSDKSQVTRTDPASLRFTFHVSRNYGLVLLCFALGLLSKNMLVTTPIVLLLLDYWPLGRFASFTPQVWFRLVAEKIPLFILTVGSCVATALVSEKPASLLPFGLRMENAVVSCVIYLWQMIHPAGLACLYPNPTNYLPLWQVAGALELLLAISGAAWAFRQTHPWLVVGWLWYVGMLIPVIGLVQISFYAHADRYTYLPQIGLYLLLTWAAADFTESWRHRRQILGVAALVVMAALMASAWKQTAYWQNNESLWTHTAACTSGNYVAQNELGNILLQSGRVDEAMVHYQQALQIKPDSAEASYHLGNTLLQKDRADEAIAWYQQALQIKPGFAEASFNLGNALLQKGRVDEAIVQYQQALKIEPDLAEARINLGNALLQKGRVDEAIAQYQTALQITPDNAEGHNNLGSALLRMGRLNEAIAHYQKALQITPANAIVRTNLDNALLQKGGVDEAIPHNQ
jgi:tetratricopeptide (TPR) repeat protein